MGLRDAVQQYGGEQVWSAGMAVLDYPPTWAEGWDKIAAVIERVKKDATN